MDIDIVDQIALIAGRLADLAGKHRGAMDAGRLAIDFQAQIAELSRIRRQLLTIEQADAALRATALTMSRSQVESGSGVVWPVGMPPR